MKRLLSVVRQAADDYGMIEAGDVIGVGVSGGKDSLALFTALNRLKGFYGKSFEVFGVYVDLGFDGTDFSGVKKYCEDMGARLFTEETGIGRIVFKEREEKNPCGLCSRMRKGALYNRVKELGGNKAALGHNRDDVIETFYMSLFYEGRIHTFSPVSDIEEKGLKVIRPLVYARERDIKGFVNLYGIPVACNPCPANGVTARADIKAFVKEQREKYDGFEEKTLGAIKRSGIDGWK